MESGACVPPDLHMRSGESRSKPSDFKLPQHDSFCSRAFSEPPKILEEGAPLATPQDS